MRKHRVPIATGSHATTIKAIGFRVKTKLWMPEKRSRKMMQLSFSYGVLP